MSNILQVLRLVILLLPLLIDTIKAVEAAIPEPGKGAAKLALVRGVIEAGYTASMSAMASFEEVWPALEKAIASIVATFNAIGQFRKA